MKDSPEGSSTCGGKRCRQWESMHVVLQWAFTFLFVNITWIFFRADSISQAFTFIKRILKFQNLNLHAAFLQTFQLKEFYLIYSHIPVLNKIMASIRGSDALILLGGMLFLCLNFKNNQEMNFRPTTKMAAVTVLCLVWGIFTLSGVSEFLYFNF
jgi:alginate O-acetyltransferase complex protein AlgI